MKKSQLKQIIKEEVRKVLKEGNDPNLIKGAEITIEMDDEDDNFNAGDYVISGLSKGGVTLQGMGKKNLFISFGALKDAGYTINGN